MPVRYTTLLLVVLLFGCSSAPPRPESPPEPGAPPSLTKTKRDTAPDTRRLLVAFGDSLTAGFGVESGYSYPDFLQRLIDAKEYPWRVANAGVSGDTTSGGVARLPLVLELKPEIVILELGANDGLRGIPVTATRANLDEMIRSLKAAGAHVVLAGMTLPPNYGADYIKPFEKIFTDLAAQHRLPLIPFLLDGVGGVREFMQQDGLHPTVEGNRRVAENVMKVLEPLLKTAPK
jgi:acyl-CoA thioesterase I